MFSGTWLIEYCTWCYMLTRNPSWLPHRSYHSFLSFFSAHSCEHGMSYRFPTCPWHDCFEWGKVDTSNNKVEHRGVYEVESCAFPISCSFLFYVWLGVFSTSSKTPNTFLHSLFCRHAKSFRRFRTRSSRSQTPLKTWRRFASSWRPCQIRSLVMW